MKNLLLFVTIFFLCLGIILFAISSTKNFAGQVTEKFHNVSSSEDTVKKLRVMSWNTAWFYGSGSEGSGGYYKKSQEHFISSLDKAANLIKLHDPHIIALQEVDFNSSKSHGIDQVKYLAAKLNMNYAIVNSWQHAYVPFPYLPIKNHFGAVSSGGAVLSKFKITKNDITLFEKPNSNPWWYNLLYLFRYNQKVSLSINNKSFIISNVHLEAFDAASRHLQVLEVVKINRESDIVMGDFNMIPSSSSKKSGFIGYEEDNYEGDKSFDVINNSEFVSSFDQSAFSHDQKSHYTFPSLAPDRRLDYFFLNKKYKQFGEKIIHTNISDHLPIILELTL